MRNYLRLIGYPNLSAIKPLGDRSSMFYMGFCVLCNLLDADLNKDVLFDSLLEHQLEKHPEHRHMEEETIIVFRVFLPYKTWLLARRNPEFWKAWRNRKKTGIILKRLEALTPDFL